MSSDAGRNTAGNIRQTGEAGAPDAARRQALYVDREQGIQIYKILGKIRLERGDSPAKVFEATVSEFALLAYAVAEAAKKLSKDTMPSFNKLATDRENSLNRKIVLIQGCEVYMIWDNFSLKTDIPEFRIFARHIKKACDAAGIYPDMLDSQQGFNPKKAFSELFRRRDRALDPPEEKKSPEDRYFPLSFLALMAFFFMIPAVIITGLFVYEFIMLALAVHLAIFLVFLLLFFRTGLTLSKYYKQIGDFFYDEFLPAFTLSMESGGKSLEILTVFLMVAVFMAIYFSKAVPWILEQTRWLTGSG